VRLGNDLVGLDGRAFGLGVLAAIACGGEWCGCAQCSSDSGVEVVPCLRSASMDRWGSSNMLKTFQSPMTRYFQVL
jgi:hypothetical protein